MARSRAQSQSIDYLINQHNKRLATSVAKKKKSHSPAHRKAISDGLKLYHATKGSKWEAVTPAKKPRPSAASRAAEKHAKNTGKTMKKISAFVAKKAKRDARAARSKKWIPAD